MKLGFRKQERALGILPEPGAEKSRLFQPFSEKGLDVFRREERKKVMGLKLARQHEQDRIIVLDKLQRRPLLLLPGLGQGKGKGPVHPSAPEGVQDHLLEIAAAPGLLHVLDQKMVTVRKACAGRLLLEF